MKRDYREWMYLVICLLIVLLLFMGIKRNVASAETLQTGIPTETEIIHSDIINTDVVEEIWTILREEYTETATAAIIGNLCYESGLYPYRFENLTVEQSYRYNKLMTQSRNKFIYSDKGYGLAMWYCTTNLERLWDWCEKNGYAVDGIEGQVRFLMADYPLMAPSSYERMKYYTPEDIVTASEDFRQSYEKSHTTEATQWGRARYSKSVFFNFGDEDYYDTVQNVKYNFYIYMRVQAVNEMVRKGTAR